MKRNSFVLILIVLWLPAFCLAGEIQRIREKGEIVVSLNREYPPFSMEKDRTPVGLDVDLAHLLADLLDVELRFIRPETYDQQIPKLLAGESDIIMAAMSRTAKRGLVVNFSDPYFQVSQAALALREKLPRGANAYFDLLEISGLRLGVKTGTTHEAFARQLFPSEAIKGYPTTSAAAKALVAGEVDAMVADSPFVRIWRSINVQHYQKVAALLAPVTKEYYSFAIRKGDQEFLTWLNLFVDQIKIDGTLDLLTYEYFDQMAWTKEEGAEEGSLNRALFLKNRFVADKKAMIEKRREAFQGKGDNYE